MLGLKVTPEDDIQLLFPIHFSIFLNCRQQFLNLYILVYKQNARIL